MSVLDAITVVVLTMIASLWILLVAVFVTRIWNRETMEDHATIAVRRWVEVGVGIMELVSALCTVAAIALFSVAMVDALYVSPVGHGVGDLVAVAGLLAAPFAAGWLLMTVMRRMDGLDIRVSRKRLAVPGSTYRWSDLGDMKVRSGPFGLWRSVRFHKDSKFPGSLFSPFIGISGLLYSVENEDVELLKECRGQPD